GANPVAARHPAQQPADPRAFPGPVELRRTGPAGQRNPARGPAAPGSALRAPGRPPGVATPPQPRPAVPGDDRPATAHGAPSTLPRPRLRGAGHTAEPFGI